MLLRKRRLPHVLYSNLFEVISLYSIEVKTPNDKNGVVPEFRRKNGH